MPSDEFQNELKKLVDSIEADNQWIELRSSHRESLGDFVKLCERLVENTDEMLRIYEREFTINGVTDELSAMGQDIAKDAFFLAGVLRILSEEGRAFGDRAEQIEKDVEAHQRNVR